MKTKIKYQLQQKGQHTSRQRISKSLDHRLAGLPTAASVVLGLIGVAGLTTMAMFAPNALQIFNLFLKKKYKKQFKEKEVEQKLIQTVYYLKKTGKIEIGEDKKSIWLRLGMLTKTNQKQLKLDSLTIQKPETWDKTYWLAAADIPTKTHRGAAEAFRRKIIRMGFYPLQKTLWLHPHNPRMEIQTLVDYFDISKFVTLIHVSKIDAQDEATAREYWKKHGVL